MKILVACEFSGQIRSRLRNLGHDAWSCDLLPSEDNSPFHIQDDVLFYLNEQWDMMIAHPPCTHLAISGARWFPLKQKEQEQALEFVRILMNANIPRIAIENPVSIISSRIRKPDQIVNPYDFGDPVFKKTCWWLKGLPLLKPTNKLEVPVKGTQEWVKWQRIHRMPDSKGQALKRSRTFSGMAEAIAWQWAGKNANE